MRGNVHGEHVFVRSFEEVSGYWVAGVPVSVVSVTVAVIPGSVAIFSIPIPVVTETVSILLIRSFEIIVERSFAVITVRSVAAVSVVSIPVLSSFCVPVIVDSFPHVVSRNIAGEIATIWKAELSGIVASDLALLDIVGSYWAIPDVVVQGATKHARVNRRAVCVWAWGVPSGGVLNYSSRSRGSRIARCRRRNGSGSRLLALSSSSENTSKGLQKLGNRVRALAERAGVETSPGITRYESVKSEEGRLMNVFQLVSLAGLYVRQLHRKTMEDSGVKIRGKAVEVDLALFAAVNLALRDKILAAVDEFAVIVTQVFSSQVVEAAGACGNPLEVADGVAMVGGEMRIALEDCGLEVVQGDAGDSLIEIAHPSICLRVSIADCPVDLLDFANSGSTT